MSVEISQSILSGSYLLRIFDLKQPDFLKFLVQKSNWPSKVIRPYIADMAYF